MPNGLSSRQQYLARQTSLGDLLSSGFTASLWPKFDGDWPHRQPPGVEVIGLVGYDTRRQQFVLVALGEVKSKKSRLDSTLSEREQDVLQLVALGYTNLEIARRLVITENTVKSHLQRIFAKLKVHNRTEAAMLAAQRGWVRE